MLILRILANGEVDVPVDRGLFEAVRGTHKVRFERVLFPSLRLDEEPWHRLYTAYKRDSDTRTRTRTRTLPSRSERCVECTDPVSRTHLVIELLRGGEVSR